MRSIRFALMIALVATPTARADFVLLPGAKPSRPTAPVSRPGPQPHLPLPPLSPPAMRGEIAFGFGNRVPLSFACRQIVPQDVKVIYGRGVRPSTIVSWEGGETWDRALSKAVAPLGLHLVMTPTTVEIRE